MAAEPAQTHATKHFGVAIGNRLASESVDGAPTPGPGVVDGGPHPEADCASERPL